MIASAKLPLLLLTAAGAAAALPHAMPQLVQGQSDAAATEAANRQAAGALTPSATARPPVSPAIASALAQWRALQQTDALPFDSYAQFVTAHPGWPGETANRRAAERQAGLGTGNPVSVAAFFRRFPPLTAAGTVAQARALLATGDVAGANAAARAAWRMGTLSSADESAVLSGFPGALSPDDQDARMDALLWQGALGAAQRQLILTSPARRPVFEARLAFRTKASNAAELSASTQALYASDPGYVADRATWLRETLSPTARTWLAQPRRLTTRPGNVEEWYEVLLVNARGAAADGNWQQAYDIGRQVDDAYPAGTDVSKKPYGERDDYTSLVWLAGQAALKKLGRPADAMPLFERYARGSQAPQTRAKGFYWAGRAAEAAGLAPQATAFYDQAAAYRDQFYGQLALERTGRPLVAPPAVSRAALDPAARARFDARETVQAARFLGQIGQWKDQTAFVRQIAADATTESDHLFAEQLSRDIGRPDLGVMVGRSAMQNGLTDYSALGFPTVPVPAGYEDRWTIIHAIARQESQFDRAAVSGAGARGLMQLMPATAREQGGKIGLSFTPEQLSSDPSISIMLGSSYFARVFATYGSYPLAIAAYNAGGGNVNKWLRANGDPRTGTVDWVDWVEAIPYSETRNYVQRVLENAVVYDLMNPARAKSTGATRLSWYLGKSRPG
ncbi:lytic transglycosylase domain-containing protein [Sphingomonas rubra]|nr:lytic transglycosylase domain-containing protein [Sphingomonas rubra]